MTSSERLSAWRRALNALVRRLLRLGLGPGHIYRLTVRGRWSSRLGSTPVTPVEAGGKRGLVAPYGEGAGGRDGLRAGDAARGCSRSA